MNSLFRLQRGIMRSNLLRFRPATSLTAGQKHFYSTHGTINLYELLGVKSDASQSEIKTAFYELSKLYHPDVTSDPESRSKFFDISEAYEILGNPKLRHNYDKGLLVAKPGVVYSESGTHPPSDVMKTGGIHGGVERRHRQYKEPPGGYSAMYDFDEFYKNHYHQRLVTLKAQEYNREFRSDTSIAPFKHIFLNGMLFLILGVPLAKYFYSRYQWNTSDFIKEFKRKTLEEESI